MGFNLKIKQCMGCKNLQRKFAVDGLEKHQVGESGH